MSKKTAKPTLPATYSTDFAIIEFKKGRKALEKLVSEGQKIKFTISGYLHPDKQSVGNDDGISTPFWAHVSEVKLSL